MSNNTVDLVSDYEVEILAASPMGISPDSHLPSLGREHIGSTIILIYNDSDFERVSRYSLEEETSSSGSLYDLISNMDGGINLVKILMPIPILLEDEVQSNLLRIEHAKDYIQLHHARLNLHSRPIVSEYHQVDEKEQAPPRL